MGMVNENLQLSFIQAEIYKYSLFSAAILNLGFFLHGTFSRIAHLDSCISKTCIANGSSSSSSIEYL